MTEDEDGGSLFFGYGLGCSGDFAGMPYPSCVFVSPDFGCVQFEAGPGVLK